MNWKGIRYFKRHEFGQGDEGVEPDQTLVELLDDARHIAGIPFVINSGGGLRTTERNAEIEGASENSAHLRGYAADIRAPTGRQKYLIMQAALEVGFRRIGVYRNHIHLDTDPDLPQDVIW